jgi:hypothetical protein
VISPRARDARSEPFTSPGPRWQSFDVKDDAPFLHGARGVQFAPLGRAGLSLGERLRARWLEIRLWRALARAAGTWRYRPRIVRWLRADVGFLERAPVRALTDHARRLVYFDLDRLVRRGTIERDPALRDEVRHIRERLGTANF